MALTDAELADVRVEVGATSPPTDGDLDEIHDRRLSVQDTILEVLIKRRADYIANPAQFIIPGEYGQNTAENIKALDRQIERVRAGVYGVSAGSSAGTVQVLTREDLR